MQSISGNSIKLNRVLAVVAIVFSLFLAESFAHSSVKNGWLFALEFRIIGIAYSIFFTLSFFWRPMRENMFAFMLYFSIPGNLAMAWNCYLEDFAVLHFAMYIICLFATSYAFRSIPVLVVSVILHISFSAILVANASNLVLNPWAYFILISLTCIIALFLQSQRISIEQKLHITNDNLTKSLSDKKELIARISHELRTPLNIIMGFSELLIVDKKFRDDREIYETIFNSSSQLKRNLDDLIDISALENQKIRVVNEYVNIFAFCREITDYYSEECLKRGIQFYFEVGAQLPEAILMDSYRVRQILYNILNNAIKFTKEGCILFRVRLKEKSIQFTVCDSGPGIEASKVEQIFKPFGQASNFYTRNYSGLGLGLSIAKELAKILNGTLELKSPGETILQNGKPASTEISFLFPCIAKPINKKINIPEAQKLSANIELAGKKILAAEDDEVTRFLMSTIFKKLKIDFEFAENGQVAIDRMKIENNFNLIFMDLQMPLKNGFEATLGIRQINRTIPIIGVSANTSETDIQNALSVGMTGFVGKPFTLIQIEEVMKKNLASG